MKRFRFAIDDLVFALRSLAGRLRTGWATLSPVARGWTAGGAIVVVLAVAVWLGVPGVPCQLPAGDRCPPHDDAAELVPAEALAYLHTNLDPDTDQFEQVAALAAELPNLSRQLVALAPRPGGVGFQLESRVLPWLEGEVAMAVLAGKAGPAQRVFLFEVGSEEGAERFARRSVGAGAQTRQREDVEIRVGQGGVASALAGGFLALGPLQAVAEIVDTAAEPSRALAEDAAAEGVIGGLPDDSLIQAYVSEEGVKRLLAGVPGTLGALDTFVNYGATLGAGAALVAGEDGVELALRSELDPERLERSPGFLGAFPPFEPELAEELGQATLAYLGLGDPAASVLRLLRQAQSSAPALLAAVGDLAERLRERERIDLTKEVLPLLGGEGAFSIGPPAPEPESEKDKAQTPGTLDTPGVPYVAFLASGVDTTAATESLAKLQGPLARALEPEIGGQAPVLRRRKVDGIQTHGVSLSPTLNLTYAAFDGKLAVATQPIGVERAIIGEGDLSDAEPYERAMEGFPDRPALIAYLNLRGLIGLAEREGLAEDPAYAFLAKEIGRLESAGLAVVREGLELETTIRVAVSP